MEIDTSHTPLTQPDPNECREFKAGVGFYAIMILFTALFAWTAFVILCDRGSKGQILFGAVVAHIAFVFFYELLSRTPLQPWYKGPTLVVDNYGLKTAQWFIPWSEIETIDIFSVGRAIRIGIVKKDQRAWEQPYLIEGPLARMKDVVRYLQVRRSAFM